MTEHHILEFKQKWTDEYFKWICGFANAEGGVLVIGKDNKGKVVGISNARKMLEDIPNQVRDFMGIMVQVKLHRQEAKEYIEIHVEPYPVPVSYKGQYHYRSGSTKQELKGAALDRFLLRKYGRTWDSVPVPHITISQLSKTAVQAFRTRARSSQRIDPTVLKEPLLGLLEKLNQLDGEYLKRAAVLLFHPEPDRVFTGAYVKIGYFRTNTNLLYQDEVHGDLFSQVEKTIDLLQTKYLRAGISYQGIQRVERFPIPEAALREAILNALIHKDYASGIPIQISVYDNKLMIWNNGALPETWNLKKLLGKHSSQPYNPDIANTFFRAGQIESWGRGIERIFEACKTYGCPKPKFNAESIGLWTEFPFAEKTTVETTVERTVKTTVKTPERILHQLRQNPNLTLAEVAVLIEKSIRVVEKAASKLKTEGLLEFVGPKKGGRWVVKEEPN